VLVTNTVSSERLTTLHEAAYFVMDRFSTTTQNSVLEHALVCLMHAAETGADDDRAAATEQVARLLRLRGWL
jgi:hypothetical protein